MYGGHGRRTGGHQFRGRLRDVWVAAAPRQYDLIICALYAAILFP